jgi:hypothetical protein
MSKQASPLATHANLGSLISPLGRAVTLGGIAWQQKSGPVVEGVVQVRVALTTLMPCVLRMTVNRLAPSEPFLQYLVGAGRDRFSARRLCMNQEHRPIEGTHKHRTEPAVGDEMAYKPADIPEVPHAPRVAPGTYRAIFEAFAGECYVEIGPDFVWLEP